MRGTIDHFELGPDGSSITALTGWALDPDASEAPVQVRALVNGVPWGDGTADQFREDLVRVGRAGQLAFRIPLRIPLALSPGVLDGGVLQVAATAGPDRTAHWLGFNEKGFADPLRRLHEERPPLPGTVAVCTMVYNEPRNLPLWTRYYGAQFGHENCWVLDHGSTDGSTEGLPCQRVRLPRDPMDSLRRAQRCSAFHRFLLSFYDTVIYVDSDEFLVPDPLHHASLAEWCARRRNRAVRAFGLDLVHDVGVEPPIDPERHLLSQRRWWYFSRFMSKPAISSDPLEWQPGFHEVDPTSPPIPVDPDLRLVHVRLLDVGWALAKQAQYRSLDWSPRQLEQRWAEYQRQDDAFIQEHFNGILRRRVPSDAGPEFHHAQPLEDYGLATLVPERFQDRL